LLYGNFQKNQERDSRNGNLLGELGFLDGILNAVQYQVNIEENSLIFIQEEKTIYKFTIQMK
jgi:hypothetical protein